MQLRFTPHAEGRMARDAVTSAEVEEAIDHPTSTSRAAGSSRQVARRGHQHRVLTVLYEENADGRVVVSCWRSLR